MYWPLPAKKYIRNGQNMKSRPRCIPVCLSQDKGVILPFFLNSMFMLPSLWHLAMFPGVDSVGQGIQKYVSAQQTLVQTLRIIVSSILCLV